MPHELLDVVAVFTSLTTATEPHVNNVNAGGLRAAKGGSVVGLGSVEREGPAGGRCPQVYDQLPDG